jgi:hypothetical protein
LPASVTAIRPSEGYPRETVEWDFRGVHYVFQELSVAENDAAIDGALQPDGTTVNNRTMTRLMILKSLVEPAGFTLPTLMELPIAAYQHIVDIVNDLNDSEKIPLNPNSSTPDGSAEPK